MKRAALASLALTAVLIVTLRAQSTPALNPTAALLQELIRIDTSNPPGHEGAIDDLLMAKLRPLRSDGPDRARFATAAAALVALLRRCLSGDTALAVTQTRRRWIAR